MTVDTGWETVKRARVLANVRGLLAEFREKYDSGREMRYREYRDPATQEIVIRIIPHTGVVPK